MTTSWASHRRLTTAALLGLASLATFAVCLGRSFLLAPADSILGLPLLSGWQHLPTIYSADFMMFSEGQLRPSSYAVLALLRSVVGADSTLFWHLLLVVVHWLNACLVASLVSRWARSSWTPLFAGLLFAVHPIAAVLVDDIGLFHLLLGLTFYLATLRTYLESQRDEGTARGWFVASVVLFLAGLTVSKLLFSAPLLLVGAEALRWTGWRRALARLAPFVVLGLAVAPLWWLVQPHPLHYSYTRFPPGATWFTFYSVVSAVEYYARGLLLGTGVPVPLHEVVPQVYSLLSLRVDVLGLGVLVLLVLAVALVRRRRWGGLGLILVLAAMTPFASVTWNSVLDYVAWKYAYAPLAGLALFLAWVVDGLAASPRPVLRRVALVLWLSLPLFAWQQIRVNRVTTSAVDYWTRVMSLNPASIWGHVGLGQALLAQDDEAGARQHLFAPAVKQLYESAATWCRYYTRKGDYLAAAIHLRMAVRRGSGLQFGHNEPLRAQLMYAVGAYDHAEAALGKVLTANPYDIDAMARLASIWCVKGYVKAAEKLLRRARQLDPDAAAVQQIRAAIDARRNTAGQPAPQIEPPSPSWLRFATQGFYDGVITRQIVAASRDHADDPVVQLEAAMALAESRDYAGAQQHLTRVTEILPGSAFAWAMRAWTAAELGSLDEAVQAGRHAIELDNGNATVHNTLGIIEGRLARRQGDDEHFHDRAIEHFREALRINPRHASAYVNLARELRRRGETEEAMALYRRVLRIKPDMAAAHFNMANLLAEQGKTQEAIDAYVEAIRARRDYPEAYYNLGVAEMERRNIVAARQAFRQVLQLNEGFAPARNALATLSIQEGDYRSAIGLLKEGLRAAPNARGALLLASLLATCPQTELRDAPAAAAIARQVAGPRQANGGAMLVLAQALQETGDLDGALAAADRAVQVARDPRVRNQAAMVRDGLRQRGATTR